MTPRWRTCWSARSPGSCSWRRTGGDRLADGHARALARASARRARAGGAAADHRSARPLRAHPASPAGRGRDRGRAGAVQPGRGGEDPRRARAVPPRPAVVGRAPGAVAQRPGTRAGRRRAPLRRPDAAPLPGGGGVRGSARGGRAMTGTRRGHRPPAVDPVRQHRDWLALVEVTGPFLSLPVLREIWPTLEPIDAAERDALRRDHAEW